MTLRFTTEQIIEKFRKVHGDRYDYSKFIYHGKRHKSIIICKKHGSFEQTAGQHEKGGGCPKCLGRQLSTDDIIKEFIETQKNPIQLTMFARLETKNTRTTIYTW